MCSDCHTDCNVNCVRLCSSVCKNSPSDNEDSEPKKKRSWIETLVVDIVEGWIAIIHGIAKLFR